MNEYFKSFQNEVPWFVQGDAIKHIRQGTVNLSSDFVKAFPLLTTLIEKASVTQFDKNNQKFKLLSWETNNGELSG